MKKKFLLFTGLAMVLLAVLLGCNLTSDDALFNEWYIELSIDGAAAPRGIAVTEYDVTALSIQVYDPDETQIQTIDWEPDEGPSTYLIPVTEQGEYGLSVTHSGVLDDDTIEVTETGSFVMSRMIITKVSIIPGFIGVISIEPDPSGVPLVPALLRAFYSLQIRGVEFTQEGQVCEIVIYDQTFDPAAYGEITITSNDSGETVFARRYGSFGDYTSPGSFTQTVVLPYESLHINMRGQEYSGMYIFFGGQLVAGGGTYAGSYPSWQSDFVVAR